MRAFDGEVTEEERMELAALVDVEPRLVVMAELREALRAALAVPGPVDIAGDVMAALDADAAWTPFGATLTAAVRASEATAPPIDLADAVMGYLGEDEAWSPVGAALREAVRPPAIDIADLVMAEIDADAAWAPLGASVRDAVLAAPPIDIADSVMADVLADLTAAFDPDAELSAYFDGELSSERTAAVAARLLREPAARDQLAAFAVTGEGLRSATHRGVDAWPAVATAIGVERDAVHGWESIAGPLREAFAAIPDIDVAGAVMAAIEPAAVRMPRWASLGGPLLGFAMAAALLFAVLPMSSRLSPQPGNLAGLQADLRLAAVNDALVEEISAPRDVVVQVMQFEDGGPTFILVDDPASGSGSGSGVPL